MADKSSVRSATPGGAASQSYAKSVEPGSAIGQSGASGKIIYRAVHTKTLWRKVGSHQSLDAAINSKDGAARLFSRKARIDYQRHGDPLYVLVWEEGNVQEGYVIKRDTTASNGIKVTAMPVQLLAQFEKRGEACADELEMWF